MFAALRREAGIAAKAPVIHVTRRAPVAPTPLRQVVRPHLASATTNVGECRSPRPVSRADLPATYRDVTTAMIRMAQAGDTVMAGAIVRANEMLISRGCGIYIRKNPHLRDDILQAGRMGFLHGIVKFDTDRGYELSTYALPWVRSYAQRHVLNEGRTIRVPVYAQGLVSQALNAGATTVDDVREMKGQFAVDAWSLMRGSVSTEAALRCDGHEDDNVLGGTLADPDAVDPEQAALSGADRERVRKALNALPARDREVLELKYFGGDPSAGVPADPTLEEIGELYGLGRERIRQIIAGAHAKMATMLRRLDRGETLPPPQAEDKRHRRVRRR